jgi:hypothetical protein
MRAHLLRILFLIQEVPVYESVTGDKYRHENEILLLVRIQRCVRRSNDARSLSHHANVIGRFLLL